VVGYRHIPNNRYDLFGYSRLKRIERGEPNMILDHFCEIIWPSRVKIVEYADHRS
jgi:hypothetical protein